MSIVTAEAGWSQRLEPLGTTVVAVDPQEQLAAELRQLAELIITRPIDDAQASELAASVRTLGAAFDTVDPVPKEVRFGGRNRVMRFLETGVWPPPPATGEPMDFDIASVVGGHLHPAGMGVAYTRDGDEAVGSVTMTRLFEGPPGRVHGGAICAIFDEVMGSVFRATGTPSAFTGELSVRFVGPAPLDEPLEFRAREVRTDGRKRFLEAEATAAAGRFATATATFINMRTEDLPTSVL